MQEDRSTNRVVAKAVKVGALAIVGLAAAIVLINAATPKAEREARQSARDFASLVAASMKDPASFNVVRLFIGVEGAECLEYRASNSFGGMLQAHAVMIKSRHIVMLEAQTPEDLHLWTAYCPPGRPLISF